MQVNKCWGYIIIYDFFPSTYSLSKTNNLNNNINDGSNKSKPKIKTITNVQPISGLTYASVILQTGIVSMATYLYHNQRMRTSSVK